MVPLFYFLEEIVEVIEISNVEIKFRNFKIDINSIKSKAMSKVLRYSGFDVFLSVVVRARRYVHS